MIPLFTPDSYAFRLIEMVFCGGLLVLPVRQGHDKGFIIILYVLYEVWVYYGRYPCWLHDYTDIIRSSFHNYP